MSSSFSYLFFVLLHLIFFVLFLSSGHARRRALPPFYEVISNYNFFRVVWIFFVCHWLVHRFLFFGITKYQLLIISYTFFLPPKCNPAGPLYYIYRPKDYIWRPLSSWQKFAAVCLYTDLKRRKKKYNFQNRCSTIKCIYTR